MHTIAPGAASRSSGNTPSASGNISITVRIVSVTRSNNTTSRCVSSAFHCRAVSADGRSYHHQDDDHDGDKDGGDHHILPDQAQADLYLPLGLHGRAGR